MSEQPAIGGKLPIPVEVKGSVGTSPFIITRNEWRAAREHAGYLLIHVLNLATPDRAMLRIFRRLGERLSEQHVAVTSWVVKEWSVLECLGHALDAEIVSSARYRWILAHDEVSGPLNAVQKGQMGKILAGARARAANAQSRRSSAAAKGPYFLPSAYCLS